MLKKKKIKFATLLKLIFVMDLRRHKFLKYLFLRKLNYLLLIYNFLSIEIATVNIHL